MNATIDAMIKALDKRRDDMERRLEDVETRLRAQFTALVGVSYDHGPGTIVLADHSSLRESLAVGATRR